MIGFDLVIGFAVIFGALCVVVYPCKWALALAWASMRARKERRVAEADEELATIQDAERSGDQAKRGS